MNTGNYIQLSGRLTADVTPNEGKTFARFTLAKNFSKDNKNARFFRCVIFKKEFDDNQQNIPWDLLKKGQEVLLTGKLTHASVLGVTNEFRTRDLRIHNPAF